MEFLFVAFAVLAHLLFWGAGAALLLLPRPWRRYWPVFAAPIGLTLQSLVVWAGAYANLAGTNRYGRASLAVPLLLLIGAAWRRRPADWFGDLRRFAGLGVAMIGCLSAMVIPLARASRTLTTVSLGSCDAADYAAGARVLMEFARGDRGGFLGETPVVQVMSVDNFFDFWLRLNHFTPSAVIALAGSVFGRAPFELISVLTAVVAVAVMPVVFWIARSILRYGEKESLWVAVIFGINPLTWYAVFHVAIGQLMAAQAIGLLTWAGFELWRRGVGYRHGVRMAGILVAAYVLILGSYNFIILVALVPVVAYAGGQAVWTGCWRRFGGWWLLMLGPLGLAALLQWQRVAGLLERFSLFRTFDFGWAIPGLGPDGWLGMVSNPALAAFPGWPRWVLAAVVVVALIATLAGLSRFRPGQVFLILSLTVPILVGYVFLVVRGGRLGTNASYDAYKLLSVFYPGVLAALCCWLGAGWGAAGWVRRLKWAMLGLVSLLNLNAALAFAGMIKSPPLMVDAALAGLGRIEARPEVASINMLNSDMWSRLWANSFLLRKEQYFAEHTYEGRLNTPLHGTWDLTSGVLGLTLPAPGSVDLGGGYRLVSTQSDHYVRAKLGEGWFALERVSKRGESWRWTGSRFTIEIDNPQTRSLRSSWKLSDLRTLAPRELEIWVGGQKLRSVRIESRLDAVTLPDIDLPRGRTVVEFRTPQPLSVPGSGDQRGLGLMIHGVELEILP